MLVYANRLTLEGPGAPDAIFRAMRGWLKEQMGRGLHQLTSDGKYDGKKRDGTPSTLRIYTASEDAVEYCAWVLKHPDKEDQGRQWITEIGVESGSEKLDISFVVRTEEMSARVEPPPVSRPRVVQYVVKNINNAGDAGFSEKSIPVYRAKEIGENLDSYRALLFEIEKEDRRYPIVLVSPTTKGGYLLDTDYLQERLIGLAQVVKVVPDFDFDEMKRILDKYQLPSAGAVNILDIPSRSGSPHPRSYSMENINNWGDNQDDRASEILSLVTHKTNRLYFQRRIRPEKISQISTYQRSEKLLLESTKIISVYKEKIKEVNRDKKNEHIEIVDNFSKEIDKINSKYKNEIGDLNSKINDLNSEVDGLKSDLEFKDEEISDLKDDHYRKDSRIEILENRLKNENSDRTTSDSVDFIIEIINKVIHKEKSISLICLELIEKYHGDKCIILEEAKSSAKDSIFENGRKLMSQLIRLVTKYREILANGGSDEEARKIFGSNEFSAKESKTTIGKKGKSDLAKKRKCMYNGEEILMERHLKISNADDKRKTIRTHFHWDGKKKIIVVGYCGEHLPVSGKKN